MMKTLSQITATFLALGVTFFAAYYIYLNGERDKIDVQIQNEGSNIFIMIRKAPRLKIYIPDSHLIMQYQKNYPKKSLLSIYDRIAQDLYSAVIFNREGSDEGLASFKKRNATGPIYGKIWISLIKRYIDMLTPEVWWQGKEPVEAMSGPPQSTPQVKLFPLGPLGVQKWSNDFQTINNDLHLLIKYNYKFLPDLQEFSDQIGSNHERVEYKKIEEWLQQMQDLLLNIEAKNYHIQYLLTMRNNYSVPKRLPHITATIISASLALIFGLIIPLGIMLRPEKTQIPPRLNEIIVIITVCSFAFSACWLWNDVVFQYEEKSSSEYLYSKYIYPLKKQLHDDSNNPKERVFFSSEIATEIISDNTLTGVSIPLIKYLEDYRLRVIESNECSQVIVKELSNILLLSKTLNAHILDTSLNNDKEEMVFKLITPEKRDAFLKTWFKPLKKITFRANRGGFSSPVLTLNLPQDIEQIGEIELEIDQIYNNYMESIEFKKCISIRKLLEDSRNNLLTHLKDLKL